MAVSEFGFSRVISFVHERVKSKPKEEDEFTVWESCGDLGLVQCLDDGSAVVTLDQLKLFRERGGLHGVNAERMDDGRYHLSIKDENPDQV